MIPSKALMMLFILKCPCRYIPTPTYLSYYCSRILCMTPHPKLWDQKLFENTFLNFQAPKFSLDIFYTYKIQLREKMNKYRLNMQRVLKFQMRLHKDFVINFFSVNKVETTRWLQGARTTRHQSWSLRLINFQNYDFVENQNGKGTSHT